MVLDTGQKQRRKTVAAIILGNLGVLGDLGCKSLFYKDFKRPPKTNFPGVLEPFLALLKNVKDAKVANQKVKSANQERQVKYIIYKYLYQGRQERQKFLTGR